MKKFNILKIVLIVFLLIAPIFYYSYNTYNNDKIEYQDSIETYIDTLSIDTLSIDTLDDDTTEFVFGARMYNAFEREFSKFQFDSICKADRISNNLNTWHVFTSKDGETKEVITEYMYIKYQDGGEYIYRLLKLNNNKYKITKRIKK